MTDLRGSAKAKEFLRAIEGWFTGKPSLQQEPKVPARNMGDGTLERDLKWF